MVVFDLAFWSANPPEMLPSRMGMSCSPPHHILVNSLHCLDGSIFPGKMSEVPWLKLKFTTSQFKSGLSHRKFLHFSTGPFCSHPGLPGENERLDRPRKGRQDGQRIWNLRRLCFGTSELAELGPVATDAQGGTKTRCQHRQHHRSHQQSSRIIFTW